MTTQQSFFLKTHRLSDMPVLHGPKHNVELFSGGFQTDVLNVNSCHVAHIVR